MNILLFLTPKKEVAYLYDYFTVRQALEKMEFHRYSAIPIIDRNGKYVGTLTEGDLLWYIKNNRQLDINDANDDNIMIIKRNRDNKPVRASAQIQDVINAALEQNFIPVIDDNDVFIGIITRKSIFNNLHNFEAIK